nr:helix-turn-helix transcriptional regulator [Propionibacterium sp.]
MSPELDSGPGAELDADPAPELDADPASGPAPGTTAGLDIGAEIARVRAARGWTMRELARRCGVADTTISRIEHGTIEPTVAVASRVLAALGRSLVVIEGGPRPGPPALVSGGLEEALVGCLDAVLQVLDSMGCSRPRLTEDGHLLVDVPPGWHPRDGYALSAELFGAVGQLVPVLTHEDAEEAAIATARELGSGLA